MSGQGVDLSGAPKKVFNFTDWGSEKAFNKRLRASIVYLSAPQSNFGHLSLAGGKHTTKRGVEFRQRETYW